VNLNRAAGFAGRIAPLPPLPTAHHSTSATESGQPSLLIRGWNFAAAMARWTVAGLPRRTQAEIDERLAICQACPFLQNNHCTKCGCACVEQNRLINKLALATEKCPEGKWS
jgi:hypothetical protein